MLSRIRHVFGKYPLVSNMCIVSGLYGAGDIGQQMLRKVEKYDLPGTGRIMAVTFAAQGPIYYYWYRFLDFYWPGKATGVVMKKLFCDQVLLAPPSLFIFFTGISILERKDDVTKEFRDKAWKAFVTGCVFWPTVQSINFFLLPPPARTVYVSACAFVWSMILCYLRQEKVQELEDKVPVAKADHKK